MIRTVVELDLIGYSTIQAILEESLGIDASASLNAQVQRLVDRGLAAVGAKRIQHVLATTGDGAILAFETSDRAHRFAQALHEATQRHNRGKQEAYSRRFFRIGIATGPLLLRPKPDGGQEIAGMTISRAVRLEAKADPGGVLVDQRTYRGLTPKEQGRYGAKELIQGKRAEQFEAFRCQVDAEAPDDPALTILRGEEKARSSKPAGPALAPQSSQGLRRAILPRLRSLDEFRYLDLVFLLEVPITQRPPKTLTLGERKALLLEWVESRPGVLDQLLSELQWLT